MQEPEESAYEAIPSQCPICGDYMQSELKDGTCSPNCSEGLNQRKRALGNIEQNFQEDMIREMENDQLDEW